MIHRTFRSLDEAPKLIGFTMRQWVALIAGSSAVLGLVYLTHLPTKPAITLCVFVIGLPAALTCVSESGGMQLGTLLKDALRWRLGPHSLAAVSPGHVVGRGLVVLARAGASTDTRPGERRPDDDAALEQLLVGEGWEQ